MRSLAVLVLVAASLAGTYRAGYNAGARNRTNGAIYSEFYDVAELATAFSTNGSEPAIEGMAAVLALLKTNTDPKAWDAVRKINVLPQQGELAVMQTAEVHQQIETILRVFGQVALRANSNIAKGKCQYCGNGDLRSKEQNYCKTCSEKYQLPFTQKCNSSNAPINDIERR